MLGASLQMPAHVFLLGIGPMLNASIAMSIVLANPFDMCGPQLTSHLESLKNSGSEVRKLLHHHLTHVIAAAAFVSAASNGIAEGSIPGAFKVVSGGFSCFRTAHVDA